MLASHHAGAAEVGIIVRANTESEKVKTFQGFSFHFQFQLPRLAFHLVVLCCDVVKSYVSQRCSQLDVVLFCL